MNTPPEPLELTVDRDSVCAGDDIESHQQSFLIRQDYTLAQTLAAVLKSKYLPQVAGGCATWIVESDRPLAVVAQQWPSPEFLVSPESRSIDCTAPKPCRSLFFRYWCQADPTVVVNCLKVGRSLPDKYGR